MQKPVSVSQLNRYIGRIIGTDPILSDAAVFGEISGLVRHGTGNIFFSLKDRESSLRCFVPRANAEKLRYEISDGMKVSAYGRVSLYERGGYYSLNIRDIEPEGEGELAAAFENLKRKLEKEGLFSEEHKRKLPGFPRRIGVVTSPSGAAIRDIVTTLKRRNPLVDILLYPALVQGAEAASSICKGIELLNEKFSDLDLIIVGRGGGSAEDLWCFNEESVARAVYSSKIPVISAVGHERDILICDFTADLRAPTPTAAAEMAAPHISGVFELLAKASPAALYKELFERIEESSENAKRYMSASKSFLKMRTEEDKQALKLLMEEQKALVKRLLEDTESILEKGYAKVMGPLGKRYCSYKDLTPGEKIELIFKDGSASCVVQSVKGKEGFFEDGKRQSFGS